MAQGQFTHTMSRQIERRLSDTELCTNLHAHILISDINPVHVGTEKDFNTLW